MKTYTKHSLIALIATVMLSATAFAAGEPENVTGLTVTAIDATSVGLTWNSAKDAEGGLVNHYRVYYGTTSIQTTREGDYDNEIDTPSNGTSYVVTGLTPNTGYYFTVTAIDSENTESEAYSLEASVTTPANGGEESDTTPPAVINVEAVNKTHVKIVFSEAVVLPMLLPEAAFSIEEQINPANTLEIMGAVKDEEDTTGTAVILETAEQTLNVNYIVTAGVAITDLTGNPIISGNADSGLFTGTDLAAESDENESAEPAAEEAPEENLGTAAPEESVCGNGIIEGTEECDDGNAKNNDGCSDVCVADEDTTPPEDITSLVLSFKKDLEKFIIVMNWTASINSYGDLVDQILYQSMDRGSTYDAGKSLGADVTNYELADMEGGKEYTFKISTKDAAGNESVGVIKSIRLPQTGVGIGLLLLGSAGIAGRLLRRKK